MIKDGNAHVAGKVRFMPEMRFTASGKAVTEIKVWNEDEGLIKVTAWESLAEALNQEVSSGDEVSIIGKWYTRTYEDQYHEEKTVIGITARRIMIRDKGQIVKEVGR